MLQYLFHLLNTGGLPIIASLLITLLCILAFLCGRALGWLRYERVVRSRMPQEIRDAIHTRDARIKMLETDLSLACEERDELRVATRGCLSLLTSRMCEEKTQSSTARSPRAGGQALIFHSSSRKGV